MEQTRRQFNILRSNYPTEIPGHHRQHQHTSSGSHPLDIPRRTLQETTGNIQQQQHQHQQQQPASHLQTALPQPQYPNGSGALDILSTSASDQHSKSIGYLSSQSQQHHHQHQPQQSLPQSQSHSSFIEVITGPEPSQAQAHAQAQHRRTVAARLEQRRHRHSLHSHQHGSIMRQAGGRHSEERPAEYLSSSAYQQYRARQRRDAGDGDAVWPDHLEDVFHKGETTSYPSVMPHLAENDC